MPELVAVCGFGGLITLRVVWYLVSRAVKHDQVWRVNKQGFYGDPYKQPGIEEE